MTDTQELIALLETFLKDNYLIRRNTVRDMLEYKKIADDTPFRPLTKEAFNSIVISAMKAGIEGNIHKLLEQLIDNDETPVYNPAKDYLEHLPAWDGTDRVKALFERIPGISSEQITFASRWLRSCVAHWMGMDHLYGNQAVLMLIGKQGAKKSTFFKLLLPEYLHCYFLDHFNLSNKFDKEMALSNNLIVNIDEFDQISLSQQAALKHAITKSAVNGRKIFGRAQQERARMASFTATTNHKHPLKDPTGSRRFICIKVSDNQLIDVVTPIDYDQLYAQLYQEVITEKQVYWFNEEESQRIQQLNTIFYSTIDLEQMVFTCFRKPLEGEEFTSLTSSQILTIIGKEYPEITNNRQAQTRLGTILTALGYQRKHGRKGNTYDLINLVA